MQYLKRILSAGLVLATILAATISTTGTAAAAPSGLNCPSTVGVNQQIRCSFRGFATEYSRSNRAVDVYWGIDGQSIYVTGRFTGGVTVCVIDGNYRSCDTIEVVR